MTGTVYHHLPTGDQKTLSKQRGDELHRLYSILCHRYIAKLQLHVRVHVNVRTRNTQNRYIYTYSRHQKKLPVLQNGTDGFVVENGKRTDTKRIAHGYRKERPVPFCFPFRSVYFLFVRSIPFTTCAPLYLTFALFPDLRRDARALSATRGPVQFNLRVRLLHTRCSANLLPVAEPKITSGQRSISVQTTERTAQMITRPVIMTDRVNTLRSVD